MLAATHIANLDCLILAGSLIREPSQHHSFCRPYPSVMRPFAGRGSAAAAVLAVALLLLVDRCCGQSQSQPKDVPRLPNEPCPLPEEPPPTKTAAVPKPAATASTAKGAKVAETGLKRHIPVATSTSQGSSSGGRHLSSSLYCKVFSCGTEA